MSSTLTVTNLTATNLTDGAGTTSTFANVTNGSAKAWVVGTTSAGITDSVNVSSGVDNGIGNYSYSYTNNMANSTWCFSGSSEVLARTCTLDVSNVSKDSNSFDVRIFIHDGNEDDRSHGGMIQGDLA